MTSPASGRAREQMDEALGLFEGCETVEYAGAGVEAGAGTGAGASHECPFYLHEGEVCAHVANPCGGEDVWLRFSDQYELSMGAWSRYYSDSGEGRRQLAADISEILAGRIRIGTVVPNGEPECFVSPLSTEPPDDSDGWVAMRAAGILSGYADGLAQTGGTLRIASWLPEGCAEMRLDTRRSIWVMRAYHGYSDPVEVRSKLGRNRRILRNEPVGSLSRLLCGPCTPTGVVLVKGERMVAVALEREDGGLLPIRALEKVEVASEAEARARRYAPVDPQVLDDPEKLAEVLDLPGVLEQLQRLGDGIAELLPEQMPAFPRQIADKAVAGDSCGIFSDDTYWWWQKRTGDLHIMGEGSARTFIPEDQGWLLYENTPLTEVLPWFVDLYSLRKLVVHEGITRFAGVSLRLDDGDLVSFGEVVLPSTLRQLDGLNCYADTVEIPESVEGFDLSCLVTECGGRLDPVTYAAKTLILPASAGLGEGLPLAEPVCNLERLELRGPRPIDDLDAWFDAGMFNLYMPDKPEIVYPARWDKGVPGSYAEQVVEFLRQKEPDMPDWSKGHDMGRINDFTPWTEKEYGTFRERFRPKARRQAGEPVPRVVDLLAHPGGACGQDDLAVGGYVRFGRYPQHAVGKAPSLIEWQILDIQQGRALLISRYGLDAQPYNSVFAETDWQTCSLRSWLNETFLRCAFSVREREAILVSEVDNGPEQSRDDWLVLGQDDGRGDVRERPSACECPSDPCLRDDPSDPCSREHPSDPYSSGPGSCDYPFNPRSSSPRSCSRDVTHDRLFLLSWPEVLRYFAECGDARCEATGFAVKRSMRQLRPAHSRSVAWWLCPTCSDDARSATAVNAGGVRTTTRLVNDRGCVVRPAMWIDLG